MICSGPSVVSPSFVSSPLFFRGFGLFGMEEQSLRGVEGAPSPFLNLFLLFPQRPIQPPPLSASSSISVRKRGEESYKSENNPRAEEEKRGGFEPLRRGGEAAPTDGVSA